jgi:hypothetical protein
VRAGLGVRAQSREGAHQAPVAHARADAPKQAAQPQTVRA